MARLRLPRYRVKDLLTSTTLIALGIGCLSFAVEAGTSTHPWLETVSVPLSLVSTASVGAGIGYLFGKTWMLLGAVAGVLALVGLAIFTMSVLPI